MKQFEWEKLGLVFSPSHLKNRPWWMDSFAQAPASLSLSDRVRMYVSTRPRPDADGRFVSYSTFVDLDGSDPRRVISVADKPVLTLGKRGTFDEFGTYPFTPVTRGPEVWAYYGGWTRCESVPFNVAIGVAKSVDGGHTFERIGRGPVLSYTQDEPFVISGPKVRAFGGKLYLFYIAGRNWLRTSAGPEPVYRIRMATSDDGLHWNRLGYDLVPPTLGDEEAQASPDVIHLGGIYHMFFSYRAGRDYRRASGSYRLGYAWSENLLDWHRADELAGLEPSSTGWDSEMVAYPHLFSAGGCIYMAYLGNFVGRDGFGLARLRNPDY